MNLKEGEYTTKQKLYAERVFSRDAVRGKSKQEIALDVGYSPAVAQAVKQKIENLPGFKNAMAEILQESDSLVMKIMRTFDERGFDDYTNKDLISALTAIASSWEKFNGLRKPEEDNQPHSRLRTLILNKIENQTVISPTAEQAEVKEAEKVPVKEEQPIDYDF